MPPLLPSLQRLVMVPNRAIALIAVLACARGVDAGEELPAPSEKTASPSDDDGAVTTSAANTTASSSVQTAGAGGDMSTAGAGGEPQSASASVSTASSGGSSNNCDMTSCSACTLCVSSAGCSASYFACIGNFSCSAYASCVQNCGDSACVALCQSVYPSGVSLYDAYAACLCSQCPTTCSGECV